MPHTIRQPTFKSIIDPPAFNRGNPTHALEVADNEMKIDLRESEFGKSGW
jgi:hypothetical protein